MKKFSKSLIVKIKGQTAVAVDFDCHEQQLYWTDVSSGTVNRIQPDGSNYRITVQGINSLWESLFQIH